MSLISSEILILQMFHLEIPDQQYGIQYSHSGAIRFKKNYKYCVTHFCAISRSFWDIIISNVLPWKSWSRSRRISFALTPFDGKWQNLWRSFFRFGISLVWTVLKEVTQRCTQIHREMDKSMAIGEIFQISHKVKSLTYYTQLEQYKVVNEHCSKIGSIILLQ